MSNNYKSLKFFVSKKVQKDFPEIIESLKKHLSFHEDTASVSLESAHDFESNIVYFQMLTLDEFESSSIKKPVNCFCIVVSSPEQDLFKKVDSESYYSVQNEAELAQMLSDVYRVFDSSCNQFLSELIKASNKKILKKDQSELIGDFIEELASSFAMDDFNKVLSKYNAGMEVKELEDLYFIKNLPSDFIVIEHETRHFLITYDEVLTEELYYWVTHFLKLNLSPCEIKESDGVNIPYIVLSKDNIPIKMNKEFSALDINISNITNMTSSRLEIGDYFYSIKKVDLAQQMILVLFFEIEKSQNVSTTQSEDVGIVSSSIAHELKNPIAGILAAIECLLIEDLGEEVEENLKEMKLSVLRCKDLVELFLSFSKKEIQGSLSNDVVDVQENFKQAFNLLRFRLIENQIRVNEDYHQVEEFCFQGDKNTFPMLIYILFNEVITSLSHLSLVQDGKVEELKVKITEYRKLLIMKIHGLNLESIQEQYKTPLLEHLLNIQNISLEIKEGELFLRGDV